MALENEWQDHNEREEEEETTIQKQTEPKRLLLKHKHVWRNIPVPHV